MRQKREKRGVKVRRRGHGHMNQFESSKTEEPATSDFFDVIEKIDNQPPPSQRATYSPEVTVAHV